MPSRSHSPLLPLPRADERAANRLEELASGLDAGLAADTLLPGSGAFATRVAGAVRLSPAERLQLEAAEQAGRLVEALRNRAQARRARAEATGRVLQRLPYLGLLLGMALLIAVFTSQFTGASLWTSLLFLAVCVGLPLIGLAVVRSRLDSPTFTGRGVPGLAALLGDFGETAYLEAIGGLYASGVDLHQAHATATEVVPVGSVRARLFRAQIALESGTGFSAALAGAAAVHSETLQLLTPAERSGTLETAFQRALERRRFMLVRRSERFLRAATVFLQIGVYGFAAWQILSFYGGYFGRFR